MSLRSTGGATGVVTAVTTLMLALIYAAGASAGVVVAGLVLMPQVAAAQQEQGADAQDSVAAETVAVGMSLVGTWLYSESYATGDRSTGQSYQLTLLEDGNFLYGSTGSVVGSPIRITNRGRWRTRDDVLLLNEGTGWVPYARFVVDRQQLSMTFADDSRELWQRIAH